MITAERYWKLELSRMSARLARRKTQARWTEASTADLERDVFLAAFSVRKLMDSRLLSSRAMAFNVTAVYYPVLSGAMSSASLPHFSHHYDLGAGQKVKVRLRDVMNQFIHSHHFSAFVPVGTSMMGIFYASDTERKKRLWYVTVPELSTAFAIASD
jgi:hypothetical protein